MSERRFTMTEADYAVAVEAMGGLHSILVEANRVSVAMQGALSLQHGLPGLTFHGALDKINRATAAMMRAEQINA